MMYNIVVQDCFFNPNHVGVIDLNSQFSAHGRSSQSGNQNVVIDLYVQCTKEQMISKACFKTTGNPYVIAALEYLCRAMEGTHLRDQPLFQYEVLVKELEIPSNQYPVALQVEGVYKEVVGKLNAQYKR